MTFGEFGYDCEKIVEYKRAEYRLLHVEDKTESLEDEMTRICS